MALRLRRFFTRLGVIALTVMFGGYPMALRRGFVMFRRLRMGFPRHSIFPWLVCRCPMNSLSVVIVPAKTRDLCGKSISWKVVFWGLGRRLVHWNIGGAEALRGQSTRAAREEVDAWLGDRFFVVVALIAGALGSDVLAGTAFATAKIMFVLALLAFFISAVVEVTRRGAP